MFERQGKGEEIEGVHIFSFPSQWTWRSVTADTTVLSQCYLHNTVPYFITDNLLYKNIVVLLLVRFLNHAL